MTFQVGRLHCLLPWWEDATVDFMINGGYNVVSLIKQVLKNNEIGYGALQSACILVLRIQTLILNLEWAIQAVQCDVNLKICLIIGFYMYLFYSLLCIGGRPLLLDYLQYLNAPTQKIINQVIKNMQLDLYAYLDDLDCPFKSEQSTCRDKAHKIWGYAKCRSTTLGMFESISSALTYRSS